MNYIFDVDGTLTPSRGRIDQDFEKFFLDFTKKHNVYLVTGSDYEKTEEQLGEEICNNVTYVFNCAGNSIRKNGTIVFENDWVLPQSARSWLLEKLDESKFYRKTGIHIEQRPGMVNFSIVGRNCNLEERAMYRQWDEHKNERNLIAKEFQEKFNLQADVAGETGIDIYAKGADKSQILEDFNKNDKIYFFGDKIEQGGNDWPLASKLKEKGCFNVKDWRDTMERLQYLQEAKIAA